MGRILGMGGARRRTRRRWRRKSAEEEKKHQEELAAQEKKHQEELAAAKAEGATTQPASQIAGNSEIDELQKWADAKAKGLITEEEYTAKKKQILGL